LQPPIWDVKTSLWAANPMFLFFHQIFNKYLWHLINGGRLSGNNRYASLTGNNKNTKERCLRKMSSLRPRYE